MTTSAEHIKAKSCRHRIHHRFYHVNVKMRNPNPFVRKPAGRLKSCLAAGLG